MVSSAAQGCVAVLYPLVIGNFRRRQERTCCMIGTMRWFLLLLSFVAVPLGAQEVLDAHKRLLEEERRANQLKRSAAEESRADLARPGERARDPKACEGARIYYQA